MFVAFILVLHISNVTTLFNPWPAPVPPAPPSTLLLIKRKDEHVNIDNRVKGYYMVTSKILAVPRGGGGSEDFEKNNYDDDHLDHGLEQDHDPDGHMKILKNNMTSLTSSSSPTTCTNNINTAATSNAQKSKYYILSTYSIQGKRSKMEDEYFTNQDGSFAAIFDGHGGKAVSRYLRQNLYARYLQAKARSLTSSSSGSIKSEITKNNKHDDDDDDNRDIINNYDYLNTAKDIEVENSEDGKDDSKENEIAYDTKKILNHKLSSTCYNFNLNNTMSREDDYDDDKKNIIEGYIQALISAFKTIDNEVTKISHWSYQGSTAVAVLLCDIPLSSSSSTANGNTAAGNKKGKTVLISANVGDSRAVLCHSGNAVDLTIDHKPNNPFERKRIEKLGGEVIWCGPRHPKTGEPIHRSMSNSNKNIRESNSATAKRGISGVYRINGNLALSRAIGDRSEKPLVCSEVDIKQLELDYDRDEFIIIASDGLWDVMSSEEAVNYCQNALRGDGGRNWDEETHLQTVKKCIAKSLVKEALRRGSMDNISVVIIWFG